MGPEYFWYGGMWIFPAIMLIVMLLVIYLIFGRSGFRPPWADSDRYQAERRDSETPLEILKKRYARSEITREEFEQVKGDIFT